MHWMMMMMMKENYVFVTNKRARTEITVKCIGSIEESFFQ